MFSCATKDCCHMWENYQWFPNSFLQWLNQSIILPGDRRSFGVYAWLCLPLPSSFCVFLVLCQQGLNLHFSTCLPIFILKTLFKSPTHTSIGFFFFFSLIWSVCCIFELTSLLAMWIAVFSVISVACLFPFLIMSFDDNCKVVHSLWWAFLYVSCF